MTLGDLEKISTEYLNWIMEKGTAQSDGYWFSLKSNPTWYVYRSSYIHQIRSILINQVCKDPLAPLTLWGYKFPSWLSTNWDIILYYIGTPFLSLNKIYRNIKWKGLIKCSRMDLYFDLRGSRFLISFLEQFHLYAH